MGLADSHGPASTEAPPPSWWDVDGAEVPLDSLETASLPDGTRPGHIKILHDTIRALARDNRLLRERLEQELKHRYGSHSEKRPGGKPGGSGDRKDPAGSGSPPGADPSSNQNPNAPEAASSDGSRPDTAKKPGHGRRPIPPGLERDEREVPLDDPSCKRCKGPVHQLEKVESYRYDYRPGRLVVRVLVRWRCVCDDPTCEAPFRIAKLPPEPIPKSRATAGFLAHLLVTKFADHCPLYRFRKILLRQGVDLPASTLVEYCKKSTDLLKPLWELMKKRILESDIIQTDDTHVQVRLPRKKGSLTGHLWAYKGDAAHPYVVFEFTPNWEGKAPQTFLDSFRGYIQADGYAGYNKLFEKDSAGNALRIEVGCWAHARRKWIKAERSSPQIAKEALDFIGQLFALEKECKDLTPDERKAERQARAAPVLEKFYSWMDVQKSRVLPRSPVAAAIEYAQNQKVALARFLEDGRLAIHNNEIEGELRAVALGRKNWMAAGSEVGGETAAIGFTMVSSARACGVNPEEWLADVLDRIVTCPPDRLEELLPDRWKAARDADLRARRAACSGASNASSEREASPDGGHAPDETQASAARPAPPSPADAVHDEPSVAAPTSPTKEPDTPATAGAPGVQGSDACTRAGEWGASEVHGQARNAEASAGPPRTSSEIPQVDEATGPEAEGAHRPARAPP